MSRGFLSWLKSAGIRALAALMVMSAVAGAQAQQAALDRASDRAAGPAGAPANASADPSAAAIASTYKLRSGDVISIRVFGEDDFTRDKVRLTLTVRAS